MFDGWIVCGNCKYCKSAVYCMGNCELTGDFIFTDLPRVCPCYIPLKSNSACEGFVKVNEDILKSKEKNTMNETGKIFDEISEILNKKNEEIEELEKKISAYEKDRNKRQVYIDEINDKLIKSNSEVNEANIRNKLLENSNEELVKDNLEHLEENRRLTEECGKLHDILCKNCKYDNDVDDICFRACKCGSRFCPEDSKELHKKIECLEVEGGHLAEEYLELKGKYDKLVEDSDQSIVELEKLVEEKNKEINTLNITKEFYINKAKELAAERDDFSKKWDKSLCKLVEKIREIDELKKQNDSVFYDILDSDKLGLPHCNYLTRNNRYPIYRYNDVNNMDIKDFTLVGYLYVKDVDKGENLTSKTIAEVKAWCSGLDETYEDNTKIIKVPKHHIAIVPMRKDGIEAAEKWVIE